MLTFIVYRSLRNGEWNQIGKSLRSDDMLALQILLAFDLWSMDHNTKHLTIKGLSPQGFDRLLKQCEKGNFRAESVELEDWNYRTVCIFRRISCPCGDDACCPNYSEHLKQELGIE